MMFALEGFHCICLRVIIILCRVHLEPKLKNTFHGPPIKNGQGHVRVGSGVRFRVRLFDRVSLQGLYGRVSFKG